jgi:hypothetical protein
MAIQGGKKIKFNQPMQLDTDVLVFAALTSSHSVFDSFEPQ